MDDERLHEGEEPERIVLQSTFDRDFQKGQYLLTEEVSHDRSDQHGADDPDEAGTELLQVACDRHLLIFRHFHSSGC